MASHMPNIDTSVRDHIPLEQGLRLPHQFSIPKQQTGQRPYSIRTRIKTKSLRFLIRPRDVRDHIPLEQGLRPPSAAASPALPAVSETIFH